MEWHYWTLKLLPLVLSQPRHTEECHSFPLSPQSTPKQWCYVTHHFPAVRIALGWPEQCRIETALRKYSERTPYVCNLPCRSLYTCAFSHLFSSSGLTKGILFLPSSPGNEAGGWRGKTICYPSWTTELQLSLRCTERCWMPLPVPP